MKTRRTSDDEGEKVCKEAASKKTVEICHRVIPTQIRYQKVEAQTSRSKSDVLACSIHGDIFDRKGVD
jgi:hypothetical protein